MRKQLIEDAAYDVATQVRAVEDSLEVTLSEVAELQARLIRANSVARVGYGTAQPALQQLAAALTSLVDSRGSIAECHSALVDAKGKVPGLRTVGFGDADDCPTTARADLRIVA